MKRILLFASLLFVFNGLLFAQSKPYYAVFDLTTGDTTVHQRVIRWINSITKEHPDAKLEVVFYGRALPMVETEKSIVANDVKKLAAGNQVTFAVCEQAMQVHKVTKEMLLPGVKTVPDAIYELVSKQAEGYGYIKVTN